MCIVSGWVVRKALTKLVCDTCSEYLTANGPSKHFSDMFNFLNMKNLGRLQIPSDGVIAVLLSAERNLRQLSSISKASTSCTSLRLQHLVLREVGTDAFDMFAHVQDTADGCDNHYFDLVRLLVRIYFDVRFHHVVRLQNLRLQGKKIRQKYTKLVLFQGQ